MLTVFFLLLYGATLDLPVLTHSSLHCALPISRPIGAAPIAWRPEAGAFDRPLLRSADAGMTSRRDCDRPGDGAVLLPSARPFGKRRACRGGRPHSRGSSSGSTGQIGRASGRERVCQYV